MRVWLILAVVVSVLLAGCAGDDAGEAGDDGPGEGDGGQATAAALSVVILDLPDATAGSRWINDTVPVQEHCDTGSPTGCTEYFPITDLVPSGVPMQVEVDFEFERGTLGSLEVWLRSEDATFTGYEATPTDSGDQITTRVMHGGSLDVVLAKYTPREDGQPTPYTIHVTATPLDPDTIPGGFPVEIDMDPGDRIVFQHLEPDPDARWYIFDPEDRYLGNVESSFNVSNDGPAGGYVVYGPSVYGDYRMQTNGTDNVSRVLRFDWEPRDPRDLPAAGIESWQESVDKQPISIGVYVQSQQTTGLDPVTRNGFNVTLSDPTGTVRTGLEDTCTGCLGIGGRTFFSWGTGFDSDLPTGSWTVEMESTASHPYEVGMWVTTLERP